MEIILFFTGALLSGLITHFYYKKSLADQKKIIKKFIINLTTYPDHYLLRRMPLQVATSTQSLPF